MRKLVVYGRENEPHVTYYMELHDDIKDKDIEVDIKEIKLYVKFKNIFFILIMINLMC
jgi:Fe-S cluster assembly iron-binding protein IscA